MLHAQRHLLLLLQPLEYFRRRPRMAASHFLLLGTRTPVPLRRLFRIHSRGMPPHAHARTHLLPEACRPTHTHTHTHAYFQRHAAPRTRTHTHAYFLCGLLCILFYLLCVGLRPVGTRESCVGPCEVCVCVAHLACFFDTRYHLHAHALLCMCVYARARILFMRMHAHMWVGARALAFPSPCVSFSLSVCV